MGGHTTEREADGYSEAQVRMPPESEQLVVTAFGCCVPSDTDLVAVQRRRGDLRHAGTDGRVALTKYWPRDDWSRVTGIGADFGRRPPAPIGPGDVDDLTRYLLERSLDGHQFNIRIQKNLRWGSRPLLAGADGGVAPARDFGHVAGIVFSDVNGDGTRSVAELGVANISIKLNGSLVTQVDENGRFEFRDVPVGRHTVELDLRSVPATYDVGADWRTVIDVAKRDTAIQQFPLVLLGRMRGRVLVADADVGDRSEPRPARNILVTLNDGLKTTMTDEDGEFEFTSLPAGWYRVRIETASLPNLWTVASGPIEQVVLEPGGRVSGLDLRVETRPRPSRRIILQQAVSGETTRAPQDEP